MPGILVPRIFASTLSQCGYAPKNLVNAVSTGLCMVGWKQSVHWRRSVVSWEFWYPSFRAPRYNNFRDLLGINREKFFLIFKQRIQILFLENTETVLVYLSRKEWTQRKWRKCRYMWQNNLIEEKTAIFFKDISQYKFISLIELYEIFGIWQV